MKNNIKENKPIIFLDIDGTLIDYSYKVTSKNVKRVLKSMSEAGYLFGLNSNRSLYDIGTVSKMFDIKGPIIAENGILLVEGEKINRLSMVM